MSNEAEDQAPAPPEALVRVQPISDPKAFKRHLLRMFDQGQPLYTDFFDAASEPWKLWADMVDDFVDDWGFIWTESERPDRTRIALALTFSMPAGTDPAANEAAVRAMALKAFAGHARVWVASEHEGPFVKMLVEYRDEDGRRVPSGPADLRRYREAYARELGARGIAAQVTSRADRSLEASEGRDAYKKRQRSDSDPTTDR